MKVVIVEDEFVAAQNLERMIQAVDGSMEIQAVLQSVEESVEWFSLNASPDVVLWIFIWPMVMFSRFLRKLKS